MCHRPSVSLNKEKVSHEIIEYLYRIDTSTVKTAVINVCPVFTHALNIDTKN